MSSPSHPPSCIRPNRSLANFQHPRLPTNSYHPTMRDVRDDPDLRKERDELNEISAILPPPGSREDIEAYMYIASSFIALHKGRRGFEGGRLEGRERTADGIVDRCKALLTALVQLSTATMNADIITFTALEAHAKTVKVLLDNFPVPKLSEDEYDDACLAIDSHLFVLKRRFKLERS